VPERPVQVPREPKPTAFDRAGVADLMEHSDGGQDDRVRRHVDDLRAAVGLERDV
jgi:hypothetical protein